MPYLWICAAPNRLIGCARPNVPECPGHPMRKSYTWYTPTRDVICMYIYICKNIYMYIYICICKYMYMYNICICIIYVYINIYIDRFNGMIHCIELSIGRPSHQHIATSNFNSKIGKKWAEKRDTSYLKEPQWFSEWFLPLVGKGKNKCRTRNIWYHSIHGA